jgi:transcriptional regulator with XRE-family HTH domain
MSKALDSLAFNVKRLRKEKGHKTQTDFADSTGIGIQVIKDAEAGYGIPRAENLDKIAKALGVEETELFTDPSHVREPSLHEAMSVLLKALESKIGHYAPASQSKARAARPESELPYEEEKLLEKIRKLTSAQKQSLDRMADQLLAKNALKSRKDSKETTG